MSAVAFDNTTLSILLNPDGKPVRIPGTDTPLDFAMERVDFLITEIQKERQKIIIPAPALAELLTIIGPDAQQYIGMISQSRIFEIASFDARCAAELAILNRSVFATSDAINRMEAYQKRKVDRQILAICKVHAVSNLYTDDIGLSNLSKLCGLNPISASELPIPPASSQRSLEFPQPEPSTNTLS
jgi:predicted nucleic acid-binding protein